MSCKFLALGCPIVKSNICCYECKSKNECNESCSGMPQEYKQCNYYDDDKKEEVNINE